MIDVVKLGYRKLTLDILSFSFHNNYSNDISSVYSLLYKKERVKEKIKEDLAYYYLKGLLLNEPINQNDLLYHITVYAENTPYKVVSIPQKELEVILVKNKMGGYLTTNIVQDKEIDKAFEELYPKLLEQVKEEFLSMRFGLKVFILADNRVVLHTFDKVIGTVKNQADFNGLIKVLYDYFVDKKDVKMVNLKQKDFVNSQVIYVRSNVERWI